MLEKTNEQMAPTFEELVEAGLNNSFRQRFEALVYLKQRNDADKATTAMDIAKKSILNTHTAQSFLSALEQINMAKQTSDKNFHITKRGEQFLYESILPIFTIHRKIAKKIFFGEKLLHGEKLCQEKQKCLDRAFSNLIQSSIPWFKKWLKKEFGMEMSFEKWFLVFEKEHVRFLKQQLENEKKHVISLEVK